MSIVLGFVYVVAAAAVATAAYVWFDAGRSDVDGSARDDWGLGGWIDYRLGDWAVETRAPSHAGGHADPATPCRCCESTAHSTYWHASR
jgi:hypothetical protein